MFSQNLRLMETTQTPITGKENYTFKTIPFEALVEFYHAFNNGKIEMVAKNWANSPQISMDNPLGGIMRGWEKIREVYQGIFNGKAKVYVEFYDYSIHEMEDTFFAVGRERGYVDIGSQHIELAIRTSRIFQKINGEWRQVHHHGSIENPDLLNTYQQLIKNNFQTLILLKMESAYYAVTTNWVIFVDIVIALVSIWLFKLGRASNLTLGIVTLLFALSIVFFHWAFGGQNFLPTDLSGEIFYAIILGGAAAILALLYFTSSSIFNNLSQEHLQIAQGFRVFIGGGFLMEGVLGVIPGWFSILDGFFHISSGFLALVAAIAFLNKWRGNRNLLWMANLVGLTDIIVIVTGICFWVWSDLGPHHNMNYVVFGVGPMLLWIHFNSIKKLLQSPLS